MSNNDYEVKNYNEQMAETPKETGMGVTVVLSILSVLIPILGLIFFLVFRKTKRIRARATGICGIAGFIISIIYSVTVLQPMLAQLSGM
ncbi:MAG: hypothetical protein LBL36_03020 [Clostridiales Family XIII bacterium]|jgi:hypothetical protein|nr:hypothetical protein [Clostridiales Family XIII bacterium]